MCVCVCVCVCGHCPTIRLSRQPCSSGNLLSLQAEKLALELHGENSRLTCLRVLEQQFEKLESILPGMDIRALIVKDSLVLGADAMIAARRLVLLDCKLGHPDLTQLIKTAPQLLYAEVRHFCTHPYGQSSHLMAALFHGCQQGYGHPCNGRHSSCARVTRFEP